MYTVGVLGSGALLGSSRCTQHEYLVLGLFWGLPDVHTMSTWLSNAMNGKKIYVNFVDLEKAFDSVHRESLWKTLRHY